MSQGASWAGVGVRSRRASVRVACWWSRLGTWRSEGGGCCLCVCLQVRPGLLREQRSIVHIKKCRYLESSGCVGMCINMCKVRGWTAQGRRRRRLAAGTLLLAACVSTEDSSAGIGALVVDCTHTSPLFLPLDAQLLPQPTQTLLLFLLLQVPTQNFFTDDFGLPLTMKPDFQTLSCDMIFGQAPPPIEQDEAYSQSCLSQCTLAKGIVPCPKTDTQRERLATGTLPAAVAGGGSSN